MLEVQGVLLKFLLAQVHEIQIQLHILTTIDLSINEEISKVKIPSYLLDFLQEVEEVKDDEYQVLNNENVDDFEVSSNFLMSFYVL